MTPLAQSSGALTAVTDYGNFLIGTLEAHAGFLLGLTAIGIIMSIIARKMH